MSHYYLMQHDGYKDNELNAGLRRRGSSSQCHPVSWRQKRRTPLRFGHRYDVNKVLIQILSKKNPTSNLKVISLWDNRRWLFTNRRTCSVDHETQGGGDFGGGDPCWLWIWTRQKEPMWKVFSGTIFKDLIKQIQVASPHWGRIVWHLTLADAVKQFAEH